MPFSFPYSAGRSRCGLRQSLLLVSLCTLGFTFGCQSHPPHNLPAVSVRSLAAAPSAVVQMKSSPLYQQAGQDCKKHDFIHAATMLMALSRTPGLAPDTVAFVERQRQICLADAHPSPPTISPVLPPPARILADADCGPRALLLICRQLGVKTSLETLCKTAGTTSDGTTMAALQQAAQKLGLQAEGVQVSREALPDVSVPAIGWFNRNHYEVLLAHHGSGDSATVTIHDPNQPKEQTISQEQFLQRCGGYLLLIHR